MLLRKKKADEAGGDTSFTVVLCEGLAFKRCELKHKVPWHFLVHLHCSRGGERRKDAILEDA